MASARSQRWLSLHGAARSCGRQVLVRRQPSSGSSTTPSRQRESLTRSSTEVGRGALVDERMTPPPQVPRQLVRCRLAPFAPARAILPVLAALTMSLGPATVWASPVDPHSFARPDEARVTDVALDLTANFSTHTLRGTATLTLVIAPGAHEVVFDTKGLTIASVNNQAGAPLTFRLGPVDPGSGNRSPCHSFRRQRPSRSTTRRALTPVPCNGSRPRRRLATSTPISSRKVSRSTRGRGCRLRTVLGSDRPTGPGLSCRRL